MDEEQRGSTPRRSLERAPHFDEVSPAVGVLDEQAFDAALGHDPDGALALLGALTAATDERLADHARRLAARVVLDLTRAGPPRARGVGRPRRFRADRADGDLDLDASAEALGLARATGVAPRLEELAVVNWARPELALCLVVDRSGSMHGERLATAALAAAACAWRAGTDHSVLACAGDVVVVKAQDEVRPPDAVAGDVLRLRGHGTTDLRLALRTARAQLDRSRARRRVAILLSDGRATVGGDPTPEAARLDELCIVAPADDAEDAAALADAAGARWVPLEGPSGVPAALTRLLEP